METREQILQSAQRLVQQRGFNGFSYADVAQEVGVRKASLHHHFPSKTDLGVALIAAYTTQLHTALESLEHLPAPDALRAYVRLFRATLDAERVCLGGMLASDALTLDASMLPHLRGFFELNLRWLSAVLARGQADGSLRPSTAAPQAQARLWLSSLQGALLLARACGDADHLAQTGQLLLSGVLPAAPL